MIEYRSTDGSFDDVEVARLVVVNYASNQSRCYVCLNLPELRGRTVRLEDLMGPASYERDGNDLLFREAFISACRRGVSCVRDVGQWVRRR